MAGNGRGVTPADRQRAEPVAAVHDRDIRTARRGRATRGVRGLPRSFLAFLATYTTVPRELRETVFALLKDPPKRKGGRPGPTVEQLARQEKIARNVLRLPRSDQRAAIEHWARRDGVKPRTVRACTRERSKLALSARLRAMSRVVQSDDGVRALVAAARRQRMGSSASRPRRASPACARSVSGRSAGTGRS